MLGIVWYDSHLRKTKSLSRRPNQKREAKSSTSHATIAAFRRAIHSKGNLVFGISRERKLLQADIIPDLVATLMSVPVYRNNHISSASFLSFLTICWDEFQIRFQKLQ
jgi:hypothetical protein